MKRTNKITSYYRKDTVEALENGIYCSDVLYRGQTSEIGFYFPSMISCVLNQSYVQGYTFKGGRVQKSGPATLHPVRAKIFA